MGLEIQYNKQPTALKAGDEVVYLSRETAYYRPPGRKEAVPYTKETVWRGIWDGEKAVLRQKYHPNRRMTVTVRNQHALLPASYVDRQYGHVSIQKEEEE